jgi:hypothetical protein
VVPEAGRGVVPVVVVAAPAFPPPPAAAAALAQYVCTCAKFPDSTPTRTTFKHVLTTWRLVVQ